MTLNHIAHIAACAALAVICLASSAQPAAKTQAGPEYSFDIWNWTAPAQDLATFDKWAADLKSVGLTRIELAVPWNALEPESGKIDLSYIRDRLAICKKHGLGLRLRINTYYAGSTPAWYKGEFWQNPDGSTWGPPQPSITDERFWEHYAPLCTAIAREFRGEDMLYNAFIGVHAELKYSDWNCYEPSSVKLWREAIKAPRPEWLARVVGNDAKLPDDMPVPSVTSGKPDMTPANLAFIAFREENWRSAMRRFSTAIRAGDPNGRVSSPLGESYRRYSAQFSNQDYWGMTRGSDQVVHSYDFFWHPGSTPVWHVKAVLASFQGITGLPVNFEFDGFNNIKQFGYSDEVSAEMIRAILSCGAGIKVANMSYHTELPSTWVSIRYAGEQVRAAKSFHAPVVKPAETVLLFYSKWANYAYREPSDWLHDAQFGYWKLMSDMGIPTRVICEDNLGEDLRGYKGIVMAFSPIDLLPAKDQQLLRKTGLPIVWDVRSTPALRPAKSEIISGPAGEIKTPAALPWDSMQDVSRLGSGYSYGLKSGDKPMLAYKPKIAILGFPLGYYYLHGADEAKCKSVMRFALAKAGIVR